MRRHETTTFATTGIPATTTASRAGGRLRALLLTLCLVLTTAVGTASFAGAYWKSQGTGSGQARTGTLAPPTSVTVELGDFDSVDLDWVAPTGLQPAGYYVLRADGATSQAACASSPTALIATSSCTDDSVAPGRYTYTVVAVAGSWTGKSAASAAVTIVAQKHLSITRQPQPVVPSNGYMGQVLIQLRDANDNNLKIKNVLVSVTINPATTTLTGGSPRKTSNKGLANFNSLRVTEPGTYTLTFSAPGFSSETSDPFTVGGFARVQATSGAAQTAAIGTEFAQPVAFQVSDAQGNPIAGAPVSFSTRPGTDGASGVVTGPTIVTTGSDGIAQTTVQAGDHLGQFAVEATTRGNDRPVTASSTLTATEPQPTSIPTTDAAPVTPAPSTPTVPTVPGIPEATSTRIEPTPSATTPPTTVVPVSPGSPTGGPSLPATTEPSSSSTGTTDRSASVPVSVSTEP